MPDNFNEMMAEADLNNAPLFKQEKRTLEKMKTGADLPENLGKAIKLPVPDFSDPNRKPTCLEVDFPIAQINALSNLEGNAGKPIYQMSKWWARRRSSVFRSMLIAAAAQAPNDTGKAAKFVWDHYYCNHQKAESFKKLKVLDCFMGGGTTLVEGSRLGMKMTGIDLNPVAWFVVKNELACSEPEQVKALFTEIEKQVKPQVQPFYTTTCPRGHTGRWIDTTTNQVADIDPIDLPSERWSRYRWEGPETIYTFWAKHGDVQEVGYFPDTPCICSRFVETVCKCRIKEAVRTRFSNFSDSPNPLTILFPLKMSRLLLYPSFAVFVLYFYLSLIGSILCVPIFHLYSSGCLFRRLPREYYFILLRYSDHAGHGIALSSLPGIAGGLRNIIS
jgi:hypothetical protein